MKHVILFALIALLAAAPAALCRADEKADHVCFRALDSDQDGLVTFQEFEKVYEKGKEKFDKADADKDGKLTHDEYHEILGGGSEA